MLAQFAHLPQYDAARRHRTLARFRSAEAALGAGLSTAEGRIAAVQLPYSRFSDLVNCGAGDNQRVSRAAHRRGNALHLVQSDAVALSAG